MDTADQTQTTETATDTTNTVADIDSFSEFKFQGESYTPEKLAGIFNEHKQYAETSKSYQSDDNFLKNIEVDIETVLKDPSKADEFKAIYPQKFHKFLDRELKRNRPDASTGSPQTLPKEIQDRLDMLESKVGKYEKSTYQAEIERSNAYLERVVEPLFKKYPYADSDAVYAKAQIANEQGYKMTDASWERLAKESHLANKARFEKNHQAEVKAQLEKGQKGMDTGAGGSAPGQAPQKPRSWNEATEMAIKHLGGR